jgi:tRNA (adenine22-N1)-methyltransferase
MAISKRLKTIAKYTEGFTSLADIACDHGYLGIYAVEQYGLNKVLLTDINPMPLASAINNCKNKYLENIISCKLGDGLAPLDDDYEVISISGIGGMLMKDILAKDILKCQKAKRLILCPNTDLYEVRKFLNDNGFIIETEEIIFEHKYYEIIVTHYCGKKQNYSDLALKYGPILLVNKSEDFVNHYKEQIILFEKQLQFINDCVSKEKISSKISEIKTILGNKL